MLKSRYEILIAAIVILIFCSFLVSLLPAKLPARGYGIPEKVERQLTPLLDDNEKILVYVMKNGERLLFREHEIPKKDQ